MKTKHWLKDVLLNFQSEDQKKQHAAWVQIRLLTGRQYSSFESHTEAICCAILSSNQEQSLKELKKLIRTAKDVGLSLNTMRELIYVAAQEGKLDEFAGTFARAFLANWTAKNERGSLAYELMSCFGVSFKSMSIYKATLLLQNMGWFPDGYACEVCGVLLETNPEKWFITLTAMSPAMNRLRGRVARSRNKDEMRHWLFAERSLLEKLKEIQVTYPR